MVEGGLPGGDPVSPCPSAWLWGPLPLVQAAGRWVQSPGSRTLGAEPGPQPCEGFAVRAPSGLGLAVLLRLWVLLPASVLNLWPLF